MSSARVRSALQQVAAHRRPALRSVAHQTGERVVLAAGVGALTGLVVAGLDTVIVGLEERVVALLCGWRPCSPGSACW